MEKILFNGKFIEQRPHVDIEDRGYQFGDGIYEVVGIYNYKLYLLNEHLDRLKQSAYKIELDLPFSLKEIKAQLLELVQFNQVKEGLVYLQVSRGVAPREHELPVNPINPVVVAYTKTLGDLTELQKNGASAILEEDIRWLRCDIKSLNLLPNTMAKQRAIEQNAIEAILHRGETITEASASNVFIVKKGEVYTHPVNNYILNGITRQKIIEHCHKLSIPIHEKTYTIQQLMDTNELFITATKIDVVAINEVDGHIIGTGHPGELSRQLLTEIRKDTDLIQ